MLFQGEVGVVLSTTCPVKNGVFVPMLTLAYINQSLISSKNYYANFENSASVLIGRGEDYKRNLFAPRLDFTYQAFCDRMKVSIYYDVEIGGRYLVQDVGFEFSFRF